MNRKVLFLIFFALVFASRVFAVGNQDAEERKTQNDEWILCITEINTGSLPPERTGIASVILRELVERMSSINYRTRVSPEYAYYEEYAWAKEHSAAAKALSAKMDERSQVLFRGDPDWRYRQNIKKFDDDIVKLRSKLSEIENNVPLINKEPVFKLHARNIDLSFQAAPKEGVEYKFCNEQKSDAFLAGTLREFHGRYVLSLKLYAVYTRSFIWEDSVIFSHNDFSNAIEEITRRLLIMLSGNVPAVVAVKTEPEETLVLINRSFAGRGEIKNTEYPPGVITVTASAADHESITFETEIFQGERINLDIRLNPIEYGEMEISGNLEGSVYHGALYIGESPLMIRLPVNKIEHIEIIALDTSSRTPQEGSVVFQTPEEKGFSQSVSLKLSVPIKKDRVRKEKDHYYWIWGTQWITGIGAWIAYYSFLGSDGIIRYNPNVSESFYNDYRTMYYLYTGAFIAFGAASAYGIYRMISYIYNSGRDTPAIAKPGNN